MSPRGDGLSPGNRRYWVDDEVVKSKSIQYIPKRLAQRIADYEEPCTKGRDGFRKPGSQRK